MKKKEILVIENLAAFEKTINRDHKFYEIDMMVMPGTLEDKHKNVDPEVGIRALRRRFNLIYLLNSGVHDVYIGADYKWLKPNDLVIVPEDMVYASSNIQNCKGYCIHFKTEYIQPLLGGPISEQFPYFNYEAEHIINLTNEEKLPIEETFNNIIKEYGRFSIEQEYLIKNYLNILLLRIREIYRQRIKQINKNSTRSFKLANKFKHLVELNFIETREVSQYADILSISPKYLSEVVNEIFGKSPRDLIFDMLLLEAKVQLTTTDKTITEIAYDLNFNDHSHFSHFIKQKTNLSPIELRRKLTGDTKEIEYLTK